MDASSGSDVASPLPVFSLPCKYRVASDDETVIWEENDGDRWIILQDEEIVLLENLRAGVKQSSHLLMLGGVFRYDAKTMTKTNVETGSVHPIRRTPELTSPRRPAGPRKSARPGQSSTGIYQRCMSVGMEISVPICSLNSMARSDHHHAGFALRSRMSGTAAVLTDGASPCGTQQVQVWLAGEWKRLGDKESEEILLRLYGAESVFTISARGCQYSIDLGNMTQTNLKSGRTRTIRIVDSSALESELDTGFEKFRTQFRTCVPHGTDLLTESALLENLPPDPSRSAALGRYSVTAVLQGMSLRFRSSLKPQADIVEWIHYWALERDCPSYHAAIDLNVKIAAAQMLDRHVLGRMQMHFETAVSESRAENPLASGVTLSCLSRVCERLLASPQAVVERQWAEEVMEKRDGFGFDEEDELTYFDFLNVMLGRKKFKVYIYLYDLSNGAAKRWSWLLLGHHFEGIWHSSIVVEWPEKCSEFWYGGSLFESPPGETPFGTPVEKRFLGSTFKLRDEVWNHCRRHLSSVYTRASYEVLTRNCNHFCDDLDMFLLNSHIPEDVLLQPEIAMNTLTAKALRPVLNWWLGGFSGDPGGRETDGGETRTLMDSVQPGVIIKFCREEGSRPTVGEVHMVRKDTCIVLSVDAAGAVVERLVPSSLILEVVAARPDGWADEKKYEYLWESIGDKNVGRFENIFCCA